MKRAYVTVLSSLEYLNGIRTLICSLKRVKCQYPLVVLLPPAIYESSVKIEKWGGLCICVEDISLGEFSQDNKRQYWNKTFYKLNVFKLTQFEKIVYLDSDMIVLKNIDHLFEKEHFTAVQGGKLIYHWEDINSGLMVIEPNEKEFEDMISLVPSVCSKKINAGEGFGDQDVISYYYKEVNKKWPESKRLDETYNAMIRCIHELCVEYGYKNLKIIHFIGEKKPWMFSLKDKIEYIYNCMTNHERYRAMCAVAYFRLVYWAEVQEKISFIKEK